MKALTLCQSLYEINSDQVRVNKVGSEIIIMRYVKNGELVNKRFRNKVEYKSGGYLALDSSDRKSSKVYTKAEVLSKGYDL